MASSKKSSPAAGGSKPSAALTRMANNLATLKTLMMRATDFKEPIVFFMDALVDDPFFMSAGKLSRDRITKALFRQVSDTLYRQVAPLHTQTASNLLITHLEKLNFSHSGGQIGGMLLTFIYFHDVDQGMVALASMRGDGETLFARFSAHQVDVGEGATFVPGNSQIRH